MSEWLTLFSNIHWVLMRDPVHGVMRVRRTARPYARNEDIPASFAELLEALAPFDRRRYSLLVDMRDAQPRNDPEYEEASADQPVSLARGFNRLAILVRTASGRLQAQRVVQALGAPYLVFDDENAALDYVSGRASPSSFPKARSTRRPPPPSEKPGDKGGSGES